MRGVALKVDFVPLALPSTGDAGDFELLFKAQDAEIFALIEPLREASADDDQTRIGCATHSGTPEPAGRVDDVIARDAEIVALKAELLRYESEIAELQINSDARHEQFVEHELSAMRDSMEAICNGLSTAVSEAICSEMVRIVAPFVEQSVLDLSVTELRATMFEMLDGSSDGFFLISGSKEIVEKLSPLFEDNKFRFKLSFVDSDEVTIEYDNHLLSTRFDHWATLLSAGVAQ